MLAKTPSRDLPSKVPSKRFAFQRSVQNICFLKLREEDLRFKSPSIKCVFQSSVGTICFRRFGQKKVLESSVHKFCFLRHMFSKVPSKKTVFERSVKKKKIFFKFHPKDLLSKALSTRFASKQLHINSCKSRIMSPEMNTVPAETLFVEIVIGFVAVLFFMAR